MKACAIGPNNGPPHTLFLEDEIISSPWLVSGLDKILYTIEADSWAECVNKYDEIEDRRSSIPPPGDGDPSVTEMNSMTSNHSIRIICEECRDNSSFPMLPACAWRSSPGLRPRPICHVHRIEGDADWLDGCREYLAWYIISR